MVRLLNFTDFHFHTSLLIIYNGHVLKVIQTYDMGHGPPMQLDYEHYDKLLQKKVGKVQKF